MKLLDTSDRAGEPLSTVRVEPRIVRRTRALQWAAALCATFAAVGIAHGVHDANPQDGWLMPLLAGGVAATVLAVVWHAMVGSVIGMVRAVTIVILFVLAAMLTVTAIGASAQAIATAISGRSSVSAELSERIDSYGKALAEAYNQATGFRGVQVQAMVIAAGLRGQADTEAGGANGTGKGQGPRWAEIIDTANSFEAGAKALQDLLDAAAAMRDKGNEALGRLRTAAAISDQQAFMAAAEDVAQQIAKLNGIDPKPIISSTGAVVVSAKGIQGLTEETAEFNRKADVALASRVAVDAPVFTPISVGEATRRQVFGTALHGWVIAAAIDVLPLLLLSIAFVLSREVWMHQDEEHHTLTSRGRNDRDRRVVADLHNGNVTRLPHAAE